MDEQCTAFVGEYEDELTRTFFNDFTPAKDRMCVNTLQGMIAPGKLVGKDAPFSS